MSTVTDNWFRKHRINVDEYYRMAEVGLLAPDARVELIDGEVIDMVPIGSRHAAVVNMLTRMLVEATGNHAIVSVQAPIRLSARSEPQPDLALLKPRADFYRSGHPTAGDVLLLVEVSDTTLRYDREIKLPLYASHGIPELWLIDLGSNQLQQYFQPVNTRYERMSTCIEGKITVLTMPGVSVDVSSVLTP